MRTLAALPLCLLAMLLGCKEDETAVLPGADVHAGARLIASVGCGACHSVPGVRGARGRVGPSLNHIGSQAVLAGTLPNTPANLLAWITSPQSIRPGDVMPDMELNENDARDIAAYLYTLR